MEEQKFSKYFNNAPVFKVGGKLHPIDIIYNPKKEHEYLAGAVETIFNINRREGKGKNSQNQSLIASLEIFTIKLTPILALF